MTVDERVNDVMEKLHQWIEAGAHKPFKWNDEKCDFVYLGDDELRRFVIRKIVEAGRQDAIEECAQICGQSSADYRKIAERSGGSAAYYAVNVCDALAGKIRDKAKRGIDQ